MTREAGSEPVFPETERTWVRRWARPGAVEHKAANALTWSTLPAQRSKVSNSTHVLHLRASWWTGMIDSWIAVRAWDESGDVRI